MEYRVGSLADLISGVKSSSKASKIIFQPVGNVNSAKGKKKRKFAEQKSVNYQNPVKQNRAEGSVTNNSENREISQRVSNVNSAKGKKKRKSAEQISVNYESPVKQNRVDDSVANDSENRKILKSSGKRQLRREFFMKKKGMTLDDGENIELSAVDKPKQPLDKEMESRTIFVKNLPINMKITKTKKLFETVGEVESVRYRCVPRADVRVPKKVAVIKKKYHPDRTTICAFVRFKTLAEAEKAVVEANSIEVDGHHIFVDRALKTSYDQRKAVFVGNLSFSAEEEDVWKIFSKCGTITNIRIVRDNETNVGRGFAYVNFQSKDAVELALSLDGEPLKDRCIRVSRAVNRPKSKSQTSQTTDHNRGDTANVGKKKGKVKKNKPNNKSSSKRFGKGEKFNEKPSRPQFPNKIKKKKNFEEQFAFQGTKITDKKEKRKKLSKEEIRKKIIAKKLGMKI